MSAAAPDPVDLAPFGLAVGHATDVDGGTGCTVVRALHAPLSAASAPFGRASATRELAVTDPAHLAGRVDAILLTGGSAYGLDAAAGVMRWHEERGRGFPVGAGVVPIVPAAAVFDLAPLGRFDARPTAAMAYAACDAARALLDEQGSVGAGTGATVGKALGAAGAMKGGFGAATAAGAGQACLALAVVNAYGDVRDAHGRILAGARGGDGRFVDTPRLLAARVDGPDDPADRGPDVAPPGGGAADGDVRGAGAPGAPAAPFGNTTLAVVATTLPLDRVALRQLARAAGAALLRRITPCATAFDGDVVFAVAPVATAARSDPAIAPSDLLRAEALAVAALEEAIERAVRCAVGRDGVPGLADAR